MPSGSSLGGVSLQLHTLLPGSSCRVPSVALSCLKHGLHRRTTNLQERRP